MSMYQFWKKKTTGTNHKKNIKTDCMQCLQGAYIHVELKAKCFNVV